MTDTTTKSETSRSFWVGRSGLIVPALLVALGIFLVYGTITMEFRRPRRPPGRRCSPPSWREAASS